MCRKNEKRHGLVWLLPIQKDAPDSAPHGGTQDMTTINESGLRLSDSIIEAASEKN